jgi:hypothetical protein
MYRATDANALIDYSLRATLCSRGRHPLVTVRPGRTIPQASEAIPVVHERSHGRRERIVTNPSTGGLAMLGSVAARAMSTCRVTGPPGPNNTRGPR